MKYNKPARVLAWLAILVIIAILIFFIYCAFTGKNFFGSLYLVIIIPVIIWAILFFAGCFHEKEEHNDTSNDDITKQ